MGQSLIKRDRVMRIEAHSPRLMPKILFVILLLLPNVCIGNPIELTNSSPPVPAHLVEIAGIIAYYEEGENYRDLGIVINEYEHDKSSPVLESTRGGSAAAEASDDRRRIVRQSVCYDVKMEIEEPEDLEIVSRKVCEERPRDVIIEVEYFTVPMIQRVVRELEYSDRPVYTYRIDDGDENNNDDNDDDVDNQDLLDFDIQFQFNYENNNKNKWSKRISARRSEWRCIEETARLFRCIWEPEDAKKRIIRDL